MASSLEQMTDATDLNKGYSRTRVASLELETTIENEFNRNDSLLLLYFINGLGGDPGPKARPAAPERAECAGGGITSPWPRTTDTMTCEVQGTT